MAHIIKKPTADDAAEILFNLLDLLGDEHFQISRTVSSTGELEAIVVVAKGEIAKGLQLAMDTLPCCYRGNRQTRFLTEGE